MKTKAFAYLMLILMIPTFMMCLTFTAVSTNHLFMLDGSNPMLEIINTGKANYKFLAISGGITILFMSLMAMYIPFVVIKHAGKIDRLEQIEKEHYEEMQKLRAQRKMYHEMIQEGVTVAINQHTNK
jgi:hypothetical protein